MKRKASQLVVIPDCFTSTINKVTSISLHSKKTFLPHLLEEHRERKEKNRKQARRKWNANTMKKHRCCTDAAGVDNMSHTEEAGMNEMVVRAILLLMPLVTVPCSTGKLHCNCCYYSWEDWKYSMYCGSIPSAGTWEHLSHTSQNSSFTSTKNRVLPKSHQGHRQLWTALLSAVNQMPQVQWHHDLTSSIRKMYLWNNATSSSKGSLAVQKVGKNRNSICFTHKNRSNACSS